MRGENAKEFQARKGALIKEIDSILFNEEDPNNDGNDLIFNLGF